MKCKVLCDFDLNINNKSLNYLYLPIIGNDCLNLYNYLISENAFVKNMYTGATFDINDVISSLCIQNIEQFNKIKSILEAMNLLNTYIDQNKKDVMIFKIISPLNWLEFKNNKNYLNLLKSKTSESQFQRIKYVFDNNNETIGLINVSATFESVFDNIESKCFDFDSLYNDLFKITNNLVVIEEKTRIKINDLFVKNFASYTDILNCCYKSIYRTGSNFMIDQKILDIKINELLQTKNICNHNEIINVNRNLNLFIKDIAENELNEIIKNYRLVNSEQYLSCLQKNAIDQLEIKTIDKLRKSYCLPDFIINILLDYCILANNGRIEPMYIQKIAITINRLNIKNPILIINHLKSALKYKNKEAVNTHIGKGVNW